jgi:tRNA-splicing ligase RtcB (3'-phosphate/5'-hydroxy nucleic acid ligase)
MNLMGHYAAATHALIHQAILRRLGVSAILDIQNHHNFAWKERHQIEETEREVIVHRKGATPAGVGVLGRFDPKLVKMCPAANERKTE